MKYANEIYFIHVNLKMGRSGKSLSYLMVESIYYVSFKPYSVTHLSDVKARNPQLIRRFSDALDH